MGLPLTGIGLSNLLLLVLKKTKITRTLASECDFEAGDEPRKVVTPQVRGSTMHINIQEITLSHDKPEVSFLLDNSDYLTVDSSRVFHPWSFKKIVNKAEILRQALSFCFVETLKLHSGDIVHLEITSKHYSSSTAKLSVFEDGEWKEVYQLSPHLVRAPYIKTSNGPSMHHFDCDRNLLLAKANLIFCDFEKLQKEKKKVKTKLEPKLKSQLGDDIMRIRKRMITECNFRDNYGRPLAVKGGDIKIIDDTEMEHKGFQWWNDDPSDNIGQPPHTVVEYDVEVGYGVELENGDFFEGAIMDVVATSYDDVEGNRIVSLQVVGKEYKEVELTIQEAADIESGRKTFDDIFEADIYFYRKGDRCNKEDLGGNFTFKEQV